MPEKSLKKIFMVAGELSGDKLAAWYVHNLIKPVDLAGVPGSSVDIQAVGGDFLAAAGVKIYQRFETLNVVGIVEIIKHLPRIFASLRNLTTYILENNFEEVVLVDFPGFNLRLAKKLKQRKPSLKITYFSPPQLWCWGAWRIKNLKKYCDRIVVLYPFEVAWYKQRGLEVLWAGSPVYQALTSYFPQTEDKKPLIALIPGSRHGEIEQLLVPFLHVAKKCLETDKKIDFLLPLAESVDRAIIEQKIGEIGGEQLAGRITIATGQHQKLQALSSCCAALTKSGTVTLELALLKVPSIVAYKVSWLTYWIARVVVTVKYMALPNLLLPKPVFKEFIQGDFSVDSLCKELLALYQSFQAQDPEYFKKLEELEALRRVLANK